MPRFTITVTRDRIVWEIAQRTVEAVDVEHAVNLVGENVNGLVWHAEGGQTDNYHYETERADWSDTPINSRNPKQ